MKRRVSVAFVCLVMAILALTSVLKLEAISSEDSALGRRDPVLTPLSTRQVMLAGALAELLVLAALWLRRNTGAALEIIVWFAAVVGAYRVAAWAGGGLAPCPCMGRVGDLYAWAPKAVVTGMLVGGLLLLWWTRGVVPRRDPGTGTQVGAARMRGARIMLWAFCLFTAARTWATSSGVALEGEVIVSGYDTAGIQQYTVTVAFEANVTGTAWWLRADYGGNYSEECGCDGEETGSVIMPRQHRGTATATQRVLPALSVGRGTYPAFAEATTRVIWFAVASTSFLRQTGTVATLPALWNSGFRSAAGHAVELANLRVLPSAFMLPESVDFMVAGRQALVARRSGAISSSVTDREFDEVLRAAGQAEGVHLARYEVAAVTNVNGIVLPREFALTVFSPWSRGVATKQQSYAGTVRLMGRQERSTFLPRFRPPVSVRDYRFLDPSRRLEEITYQCTAEVWPARDDPGILSLVRQRQTLNAAQVRGASSRTAGQVAAILLGSVLVGALPWLVRRWRSPSPLN